MRSHTMKHTITMFNELVDVDFWLQKKTQELHHLCRECIPLMDNCANKHTEAGKFLLKVNWGRVPHLILTLSCRKMPKQTEEYSEIASNTNRPSHSKSRKLHRNETECKKMKYARREVTIN